MDHNLRICLAAPAETKKVVARPAEATPKLMDICCIVLAIVLAALVSSSVMSANTSVFMLVYCSEVKVPVAECEQHDFPHVRALSDGAKKQEQRFR